MRLKRKIHSILSLCLFLMFTLGWYFNSFQKEMQYSLDSFMIAGKSRVQKLDSDVHVAAMVGLYINTKLQEMNFSRNVGCEILVRRLLSEIKETESPSNKEWPWKVAASWVTGRHIHPEWSDNLGSVLTAMAKAPITLAEVPHKGTQLKAMLTLEGNQSVFFKPMRFSRDHIIQESPYAGADRHNGEIAAFHLNRLLGFHRCPLVVGRKVNLRTEVQKVATPTLLKTFFQKGEDLCFYGVCFYCQPDEAACGEEDILEGALLLSFPSHRHLKRFRSPWRRTYKANVSARWELDRHYCQKVVGISPFSYESILLDAVDASVLDYLIGNADRHSYELFSRLKDPAILLLDNGKSFGNPYWDELTILAPLYQCCRLRKQTFSRLELLVDNLGESLGRIMASDPLHPVLSPPHLDALDRRLKVVLAAVAICIEKEGLELIKNVCCDPYHYTLDMTFSAENVTVYLP